MAQRTARQKPHQNKPYSRPGGLLSRFTSWFSGGTSSKQNAEPAKDDSAPSATEPSGKSSSAIISQLKEWKQQGLLNDPEISQILSSLHETQGTAPKPAAAAPAFQLPVYQMPQSSRPPAIPEERIILTEPPAFRPVHARSVEPPRTGLDLFNAPAPAPAVRSSNSSTPDYATSRLAEPVRPAAPAIAAAPSKSALLSSSVTARMLHNLHRHSTPLSDTAVAMNISARDVLERKRRRIILDESQAILEPLAPATAVSVAKPGANENAPSVPAGAAASAAAPALTFGTETPSKSGWAPPRNVLMPARGSALGSSTGGPSADKAVTSVQPSALGAAAIPVKQPAASGFGFPASQPAFGMPLESKPLASLTESSGKSAPTSFPPSEPRSTQDKAASASFAPESAAKIGEAKDSTAASSLAKPVLGFAPSESKPKESVEQAPKPATLIFPGTTPAASLPAGPLEHAPPLRLDETSLKTESNTDSTFLKFARASSLLAQIPSPSAAAPAPAVVAAASFAPRPTGFAFGASSQSTVVDKFEFSAAKAVAPKVSPTPASFSFGPARSLSSKSHQGVVSSAEASDAAASEYSDHNHMSQSEDMEANVYQIEDDSEADHEREHGQSAAEQDSQQEEDEEEDFAQKSATDADGDDNDDEDDNDAIIIEDDEEQSGEGQGNATDGQADDGNEAEELEEAASDVNDDNDNDNDDSESQEPTDVPLAVLDKNTFGKGSSLAVAARAHTPVRSASTPIALPAFGTPSANAAPIPQSAFAKVAAPAATEVSKSEKEDVLGSSKPPAISIPSFAFGSSATGSGLAKPTGTPSAALFMFGQAKPVPNTDFSAATPQSGGDSAAPAPASVAPTVSGPELSLPAFKVPASDVPANLPKTLFGAISSSAPAISAAPASSTASLFALTSASTTANSTSTTSAPAPAFGLGLGSTPLGLSFGGQGTGANSLAPTSAAPATSTSASGLTFGTLSQPALPAKSLSIPSFGASASGLTFGTPTTAVAAAAPAASTSAAAPAIMFGAPTAPTSAATSTALAIAFGAPAPTLTFGATSAAPASSASSTFKPSLDTPLFGASAAPSSTAAPASLFGAAAPSMPTPLFGANGSTRTPVFGALQATPAATSLSSSAAPSFGATSNPGPTPGLVFGAPPASTAAPPSFVFGAAASQSVASTAASAAPFGHTATPATITAATPTLSFGAAAPMAFGTGQPPATLPRAPSFGNTPTLSFGATQPVSASSATSALAPTPSFGATPALTFGSSQPAPSSSTLGPAPAFVFGAPAPAPSFGTPAASAPSFGGAPLFGSLSAKAPADGTGSSLFGAAAASNAFAPPPSASGSSASTFAFGGAAPGSSSFVFGQTQPTSNTQGSPFGASTPAAGKTAFGNTTSGIFGGASTSFGAPANSMGGGMFGSSSTPAAAPMTGGSSLFGASQSSTFGSAPPTANTGSSMFSNAPFGGTTSDSLSRQSSQGFGFAPAVGTPTFGGSTPTFGASTPATALPNSPAPEGTNSPISFQMGSSAAAGRKIIRGRRTQR